MKKLSFLVAIILVIGLLLSACGSGSSNSNSGNSVNDSGSATNGGNTANTGSTSTNAGGNNAKEEPEEYEIPAGTTITIVNGGGTAVEAQMERYGKYLQQKFPQVNFEIKSTTKELTIDKMILAGEKFDIFIRSIGSFFYEVPQNGFQYDMTELVEKHNVDLSVVDPVLIQSMTDNAGGELWGIPFSNSGLIMYYNKDIFDMFGVDYPTDGMTWDEVYEIAKVFNQTKDGQTYVGLAYSNHHMTKLNNFGLSYVDPNTGLSTYDDERWKYLLDIFYTPTQDPGYQDFLKQNEGKLADSNSFTDGKAAMLVTIVHHPGAEWANRPDFHWDMVSFPTFAENPGVGSQAYPEYLAIPSFSENKDAAMKVIEYLISDEFQMEFSKNGNIPVSANKEIQAAFGSGLFQDKNQASVFYNPFAPVMMKSIYDNDVEKKLTQYINQIAGGQIDINTALRQAKEEADLVIAEKSGK
jgi:multiple sugar transport system substrate-binding protein